MYIQRHTKSDIYDCKTMKNPNYNSEFFILTLGKINIANSNLQTQPH